MFLVTLYYFNRYSLHFHICYIAIIFKASSSEALRQSNRIHTEVKPHRCGQCSKTFSTKANLRMHERILHAGEKSYQCEFCDISFM